MCDLTEAADIVRRELAHAPTWANERRLELYRYRAAPHMAADPLHYVERFLRGTSLKRELRLRPIPRHRALVVV